MRAVRAGELGTVRRTEDHLPVDRMMISAWDELSLFESHDVVRDRFKDRHGRELSAEKASEVVAFFSQGRQYFDAADSAESLVSPLLYYYGVNAITRGAILFLEPSLRQASLKPSHGLSVSSWQSTLAAGLTNLGDLRTDVETTGTFPELTRATANRGSVLAATDKVSFEYLRLDGSHDIPAASTLTLKEVLSRIPDLNELYEEVLGEPANVFSVGINIAFQSRRTDLEVYGTVKFPPDEARLRAALPELSTAQASPKTSSIDPRLAIVFVVPPDTAVPNGLGKMPPLRYAHGATWLVLPFSSGLDLSPVAILYLFGFKVGMLSRYFPQHWLSLLSGQRGDRLYPLIREGISVLARRFPSEMAAQIAAV